MTVRSYKVIYDLLDDMRAAMEGKLAALEQRIPLGEAEVRAVFGKGSKLVAGCIVTEGSLRENCFVVVSQAGAQGLCTRVTAYCLCCLCRVTAYCLCCLCWALLGHAHVSNHCA